MNRMEEYQTLLQELEPIPAQTQGCVARAVARRNRSRRVWRPLGSVAAVLAIFIGLVNLSPSVSAACMEIPLLDKLTEAVLFSHSLQAAVENDYVQPLGLEQTKNGVTVRVEHVIVDQKQVNVFYSVTSDEHLWLTERLDLLDVEGNSPQCAVVTGDYRVQQGQLRHVTVDFAQGTVPSQLRLLVDVMEVSNDQVEPSKEQWDSSIQREALASFDFLMSFDPTFTQQGRVLYPGVSFTLDGNTFTVAELGVYPSQIRIRLEEAPENESWLESLHFYLELDDGTRMEPGGNGISAYGDSETRSMTTYLAQSSYFSQADRVRLVITGADLLDRQFGRSYVNLQTQQAENLPTGWEFISAEESADGWELRFLRPDDGVSHTMGFDGFYDSAGNRLETDGLWGRVSAVSGQEPGTVELAEMGVRLKPFAGQEVWIEPHYSESWYAAEPLVLELELQQD